MMPQSLGVIGGKPNSAHYFIGHVGECPEYCKDFPSIPPLLSGVVQLSYLVCGACCRVVFFCWKRGRLMWTEPLCEDLSDVALNSGHSIGCKLPLRSSKPCL